MAAKKRFDAAHDRGSRVDQQRAARASSQAMSASPTMRTESALP